MPLHLRYFITGFVTIYLSAYASFASAVVVTTLVNSVDSECSFQEAVIVSNSNVATGDCPATDFSIIEFEESLFEIEESSDNGLPMLTLNLSIAERLSITEDLTIKLPTPTIIDDIEYGHRINAELIAATKDDPLFSLSDNITFSLTGWLFDGNQATDATVISLGNNTQLNFDAVTIVNFIHNESTQMNSKGLIHSSSNQAGNITIKNSVFRDNGTSGNGTVLNVDSSLLDIQNSVFSSNRAETGNGGVIALSGTTRSDIRQSVFFGNGALNGGAIMNIDNTGALHIENSTFILNLSSENGGAINTNGSIYVYSSTFLNNIADTNTEDSTIHKGGALYIDNNVTQSEIYNALFLNNQIFSSNESDCSRPLSVLEYSVIKPSDNCTFPASPVNVMTDSNDIEISIVSNSQGDQTAYRTSSEKILDQGNPSGCLGLDSTSLSKDVDGNTRGSDKTTGGLGICDIGSSEFKPLTLSLTSDEADYEVDYDETLEEQDNISVTLTIENFGETTIPGINMLFLTPYGYSTTVDGEMATGIFKLADVFELAAGEKKYIDIVFVPTVDNVTKNITFQISTNDFNNSFSNEETKTSTNVNLKTSYNQKFFVNPDIEDENDDLVKPEEESSNGAIFWLLPLLGVLTLLRRNTLSK